MLSQVGITYYAAPSRNDPPCHAKRKAYHVSQSQKDESYSAKSERHIKAYIVGTTYQVMPSRKEREKKKKKREKKKKKKKQVHVPGYA